MCQNQSLFFVILIGSFWVFTRFLTVTRKIKLVHATSNTCYWNALNIFGNESYGQTNRHNITCRLLIRTYINYLEWTVAWPQDQANDLDLGRLADMLSLGPWTWHITAEVWSCRSASSSATRRCAAPSATSIRPRRSSHPAVGHRGVNRRRLGSLGGVLGVKVLPKLWNETAF